jgi:hypothetical protein
MKPNSKPKETKGKGKRKIHYDESVSALPTEIDEN